MWQNNKKVERTYAEPSTQWVWAKLEDLEWTRIRNGAADGCTNLFIMMNAAKANGGTVSVKIENELITAAYLN